MGSFCAAIAVPLLVLGILGRQISGGHYRCTSGSSSRSTPASFVSIPSRWQGGHDYNLADYPHYRGPRRRNGADCTRMATSTLPSTTSAGRNNTSSGLIMHATQTTVAPTKQTSRTTGSNSATNAELEKYRRQIDQQATDWKMFKRMLDVQTTGSAKVVESQDILWEEMRRDAEIECRREPLLQSQMLSSILNHKTLEEAVAFHLATKLATPSVIGTQVQSLFMQCFEEEAQLSKAIRADILAVMDRDPACRSYLDALLFFKGFQALQTHRVAHWLWRTGRDTVAFYLQSQINQLFQIDIHPAARIGEGVFIDHGTGVVIGETAVVGHNVSMLHMVTLGGSGKKHVDRHPKIGDGVLLGAGSTLLGNVKVGAGSLIGACSLVLDDIPPHSVAVGVPAKVVGQTPDVNPAQSMRHTDAIVGFDDLPEFVI